MPTFEDSATSNAPPEEVWKILYDPTRFPEWWAGAAKVEREREESPGRKPFTLYQEGSPDFPIPRLLETVQEGRHVVVSCLISDIRFEWRLEPLDGGDSTRISVLVEVPEAESEQLAPQRDAIHQSLTRLAAVAAERSPAAPSWWSRLIGRASRPSGRSGATKRR